ncbi:MAG TPA: hypothetical protein P5513_03615 [Candidatus Diapherotrites archaeon]|nr:hypothetical protein [Candidatus Diapherotrites archaeon]
MPFLRTLELLRNWSASQACPIASCASNPTVSGSNIAHALFIAGHGFENKSSSNFCLLLLIISFFL